MSDRNEGRAGTGPGGPAGAVPSRFTSEPGECQCPDCDTVGDGCPCFSQHVTGICACCRAGLHDHTCGAPPVCEVEAG